MDYWKDEESLLRRPALTAAQQRLLATGSSDLGESEVAQQGGESGEKESTPLSSSLKRMLDSMFEGSGLEIGLKIMCCPLVVPVGVMAAILYFLMTRGFRLIIFLLRKLSEGVAWLVGMIPIVFGYLFEAVVAACAFIATVWSAISACWVATLDWLSRHFKALLFGLYDALIAPIVFAVDKCLLSPLKTAVTACCEKAMLPFAEWLFKRLGECTPKALEAVGEGCKVFGTGLYDLDGLVTTLVFETTAALIHALHEALKAIVKAVQYMYDEVWSKRLKVLFTTAWEATVKCCEWLKGAVIEPTLLMVGNAARATWRGVEVACEAIGRWFAWLNKNVLTPLCTWVGEVMAVAGRALGSCCEWFGTNVLAPMCEAIGRMIKAVCEAIGRILTAVWEVIAKVAVALWEAIVRVVALLWQGVAAGATAVGNATQSVLSAAWAVVAPACEALGNGVAVVAGAAGNAIQAVLTAGWAVLSAVAAAVAAVAAVVWTAVEPLLAAVPAVAAAVWKAVSAVAQAMADVVVALWMSLMKCVGAETPSSRGAERYEPLV